MCVPDVVKNIDVRVFNLMPRTNETRYIEWHETCNYKCRCECKELTGKIICDEEFIWNHSNCECEYDKSCDVGEYLDYENSKCRKRLFDKLVEECSENIDENKLVSVTLNDYKNVCGSCTIYIDY